MIEPPRSAAHTAILIPAFGAADKLAVCLQSLAQYAPPDCRIFVLDDATPDDSVASCVQQHARPNLSYVRNAANRGFVATCNWGWSQIAPPESDILLLNSDTEVTQGFLEEMLRVLYLNERHGVVTPRSNNATIYSVPLRATDTSPAESFSVWQEMQSSLPRYRVMPTAVGFCMLVKASVLACFGLFDEIYSPGYNEENDFICRINRYGYSAVVANHAFVYHYESSTFGTRRKILEAKNSEILVERFPEYRLKVSAYLDTELDPIENFAILRRKHRPLFLYDLFHLPAKHSGSSEFALSLLREVHTQLEDEWDIFVGVSEAARFFSSELNGYRLFEDRAASDRLFDLAFKPAQIFTWEEFRRMHRLSPRLSFVLQDIIAVRCDYLAGPARKVIFRKTIEMADQLFTISDFSRTDCEAYFDVTLPQLTIHHGTNAGITQLEAMKGEYVLLIGNSFAHKGISEAVQSLTDVGPVRVLGGDRPEHGIPDHVSWVKSGQMTRGFMRELYARASVLVYPSFYEGYGLPIIEGLALGKPVIAVDNQLNRELAAELKNENLTLVKSLHELETMVPSALIKASKTSGLRPAHMRRWSHVAKDYAIALRHLMHQPQNASLMRARSDFIRVLDSAQHL